MLPGQMLSVQIITKKRIIIGAVTAEVFLTLSLCGGGVVVVVVVCKVIFVSNPTEGYVRLSCVVVELGF